MSRHGFSASGRGLAWWLAPVICGVVGLVLALLFLLAMLASLAGRARAHDWYPLACCSDQDCREMPRDALSVTATGWGDTRLRLTPPEREGVHWCTAGGRADGRTLCLFVEPQGS